MNGVVMYERLLGVLLCERGRRVNCVRYDTFYFEILIRHLERARGNIFVCRHLDLHSKH